MVSAIVNSSLQTNCSNSSAFTSVKERRIKASVRDPDPPVHIEEEESNAAIFSCPEEGCVKTFVRYSSMQRHLDCGKQRALERYTLLRFLRNFCQDTPSCGINIICAK